MTVVQQVISIAIAAVANFFTRVVPFLVFGRQRNGKEELSPFIEGLSHQQSWGCSWSIVLEMFTFLVATLAYQKLLLVLLQSSSTYENEACVCRYW